MLDVTPANDVGVGSEIGGVSLEDGVDEGNEANFAIAVATNEYSDGGPFRGAESDEGVVDDPFVGIGEVVDAAPNDKDADEPFEFAVDEEDTVDEEDPVDEEDTVDEPFGGAGMMDSVSLTTASTAAATSGTTGTATSTTASAAAATSDEGGGKDVGELSEDADAPLDESNGDGADEPFEGADKPSTVAIAASSTSDEDGVVDDEGNDGRAK